MRFNKEQKDGLATVLDTIAASSIVGVMASLIKPGMITNAEVAILLLLASYVIRKSE